MAWPFLVRCSPLTHLGVVLLLLSTDSVVRAWITPPAFHRGVTTSSTAATTPRLFADRTLGEEGGSAWGTADNWDDLSRINKPSVTSEMLETDYLKIQAMIMENFGMHRNDDADEGEQEPAVVETTDDQWIRETIENFVVETDQDDHAPSLLSRQEATSIQQEERYSTEITRLIRCNESPQSLLLATGRAIPPLTEAERNDIRQLLNPEPTVFLEQSVRAIFQRHARSKISDEAVPVMKGGQIARWMQVCLEQHVGFDNDQANQPSNSVSAFDGRVRSVLGQYGQSGAIYEEGLQRLYVEAAHSNPDAVWRDLRAHGIVSPAEFEHSLQVQDLTAESSSSFVPDALLAFSATSTMPLDECDLMEDDNTDVAEVARTDRHGKSSHEKVELVPNTQVPLWIKDGEFVFIDEQSCIGCMQCALASPGSFQMLPHSGRARTFQQRGRTADIQAAVHSCPVDCMHYVSFDELKKFETIRDEPVAEHHRHFGHTQSRGYVAATPLHVSRRDSDASHKDSFYHFQRNQCFKSTQCPTKGCFDCPRYKEDPGGNPYFQAKLSEGYHMRSMFLTDTGIADEFRKKVDL